MTGKKIVWISISVVALVVVLLLLRAHRLRSLSTQLLIEGTVIQSDVDTNKQLPIADVAITASDGAVNATARSETSGYFKVTLQRRVLSEGQVIVSFRHPSYEPYDLNVQVGRLKSPAKLYVVRMVPVATKKSAGSNPAGMVVANIRVRYTLNSRTDANVGSEARTFRVVNQGNVPCNHQFPCSPDGKWKASSASVTVDAGADNLFRNVRASCIAGPCPFTRIDSSGFIRGGRKITITALNWSDTATFLLEAEVYHSAINSSVRELYPVTFGRTLSFTLPPIQEGVSLEAEINGSPMVFPLGPKLNLSWATCTEQTSADQEKTMMYRCELKPEYRFQ